ncbi:hypothetical protein [Halomonas sp.]|uniref:hypothetical protein n=1 Tax=Halomonas sp. TaxID=1486246 RepID=UPI00298D9AA2|nr:hypothetical protein [Halomonas sp.]MDW7745839.1 hypothetical protein [Halomonas sp.]
MKFEITNTGNLQHEFVIGDATAQAAHREMMRDMAASGHGHGNDSHHGGGDAMPSVTIDPNETATLVSTARRQG